MAASGAVHLIGNLEPANNNIIIKYLRNKESETTVEHGVCHMIIKSVRNFQGLSKDFLILNTYIRIHISVMATTELLAVR